MAKTGRKPRHYTTPDGDKILGLARRSGGRWRIISTGKTFNAPTWQAAVKRFRAWESHNRGEVLDIPVIDAASLKTASNAQIEQILAPYAQTDGVGPDARTTRAAMPQAIWDWFAEQLRSRPKYVAERTGIEQIAYLQVLKPPDPSPTLAQVGDLYLTMAKISEGWRDKCKQFWSEFSKAVGVALLRDLEQEHLVTYGDLMREQAQTATYLRQRYGAIKTLLNFPPKRGKWAEDCKRAVALCAVLVPPRKSAVDPHPISTDDFACLYRAADQPMRAMLLMALNCCMYGGEVAAVAWKDLDLTKGILVASRPKTGIVRVAVLWPETVAALRALERGGKDAVLQNDIGGQADYLCLLRRFRIVRTAAGLPAAQLSQIRDGAYTAAVEAGIDINACRLLAGHATGISDHYVMRRPQMVASACAAIRQA